MLLVFVAGCGLFRPDQIDERDFPELYGGLFCDRAKECDRGGFEREYKNKRDCNDTQDVLLRTLLYSYDELDCEYTRGGAGDAYKSLAKMSCGDFYEAAYIEDYGTIWAGCGQDDDTGTLSL